MAASGNHVATSLHQPHALITRLDHDTLYVFVNNDTVDTTFVEHDKFPLGLGVCCETTMTRNAVNFVPNALVDPHWQDNPSVGFSLISYIGAPVRWPDGELFGTICALGEKPMANQRMLFDDILLFKSIVETDLQLLLEKQEKAQKEHHFDTVLSEVHHRVKNHLNILCGLIQLDWADCDLTKEEFAVYQTKLEGQIKAVSELHTLMAYEGRESVELSSYLSKMIDGWLRAAPESNIRIQTSLDKIDVAGKKVVYLGVLLNELITNSFTHAFAPDHPDPVITITMQDEGDRFRILYKDNGSGCVDNHECSAQSLGMSMLAELTTSMGGTMSRKKGVETLLVFPKWQE